MKDKKALTARCGLDCFNCELYEENVTSDLAERIHVKLGVPKKQIPCRGWCSSSLLPGAVYGAGM